MLTILRRFHRANRKTHEPKTPSATVPQTLRQVIKQQLGPTLEGRLSSVLIYPEIWWDLRLRAWVDHGVRDEEGVPTEFEEPVVYLTISVHGKEDGKCVYSQSVNAAEVPILAAAFRAEIQAEIIGSIVVINQEVRRFWGMVGSLRNQVSKLQQLNPGRPSCGANSTS